MKAPGTDTVLLADHEPSVVQQLGQALKERGYVLFTADDGQTAFRIFRDQQPRIILAGMNLPDVDGLELLRRMKRDRPESEVVLVNDRQDTKLVAQCLKQGACDVLSKPVDRDLLDIGLRRAEEKISMCESLKRYTEDLENMVREKSARLIQAERAAAACQVMDRFFSAMSSLADETQEGELSFLNEMPCYLSLHSPDLEVIYANQLFEDCFGDLLGAESWRIYAKRVAGTTECPVRKTFETGKGQRSRELVRSKDEVLFPVEVHTVQLPGGETCEDMVLELCVDISRMEELRSALAATQQRYQQLFDEVPCYISVLDPGLRICAANKRFKEDFGDPGGGNCFVVFKNRERPCPDCPVLLTFEDGQPHQIETTVRTMAGQERSVLISTSAVRDAQGDIDQVMEVSTDITMVRELQDHLSSLGLLLGTVSHEMKNVLTLLDAGIYKVNTGLERGDQARVREGWQTVTQKLGRIKKIVVDILQYATKRELEMTPVPVRQLADEAFAHIRPRLEAENIPWRLDLSGSVEEVVVDADKMHSALTNLLDNALDACLAAEGTEAGISLAAFVREHGETVLQVADTGVGLDPANRARLFSLFSSSKGARGNGLGLFVVKQVVDQHGGSIEVDSEPGAGSTFRIVLPPCAAQSPESAQERRSWT